MVVTLRGREFPALGKFFMNLRRPKEYKGKGRLGVKSFLFSCLSLSPLWSSAWNRRLFHSVSLSLSLCIPLPLT